MIQVLFVCVHNAGRSQMAKALFDLLAAEGNLPYRAESAGTEPAGAIHSNVVETMRELGIDIADQKPKLLTDAMVRNASKVITMGCAVDSTKCPAIFLKNVVDWGLPDPRGKTLEEVRVIRDTIRLKVRHLIEPRTAGGA